MELDQKEIESNRFFYLLKKFCENNKKELKFFKTDINQYLVYLPLDKLIFHVYQIIEGDESLSYFGVGLVESELKNIKIVELISQSLGISNDAMFKALEFGQLNNGILGGQSSFKLVRQLSLSQIK